MESLINGYFYFRAKFFESLEQKHVEKRFYSHAEFARLDQQLLGLYEKKSPYQMSKEYLIEQEADDVYTYGETPLTTMDRIVKECQITKEDRCIEMGAGRGRAALFLSEVVGCSVKAYELIPSFVKTFQKLSFSDGLEMIESDFFQADYSWPTVVFLYGTMLKTEEIKELAKKLCRKTKIISVSYSLEEYATGFVTKKAFPGHFPWGKTTIYWSEKHE